MKEKPTIFILICCALILAALISVHLYRIGRVKQTVRPPVRHQITSAGERFLDRLNGEKLKKIHWSTPFCQIDIAQDASQHWYLQEDVQREVDQKNLQFFVSTLTGLPGRWQMLTDLPEDIQASLAQGADIHLEINDDQQRYEGLYDAENHVLYLSNPTSGNVFQTLNADVLMKIKSFHLRTRQVVDLKTEEIRQFRIQHAKFDQSIEIHRNTSTSDDETRLSWTFASPFLMRAHPYNVSAFLDEVTNLKALYYEAEGQDQLARYGLDHPRVIIQLYAGKEQTETLILGAPFKENLCYGYSSQRDAIFVFKEASTILDQTDLKDWVDPYLMRIKYENVRQIRLDLDQGNFVFERLSDQPFFRLKQAEKVFSKTDRAAEAPTEGTSHQPSVGLIYDQLMLPFYHQLMNIQVCAVDQIPPAEAGADLSVSILYIDEVTQDEVVMQMSLQEKDANNFYVFLNGPYSGMLCETEKVALLKQAFLPLEKCLRQRS